MASLEQIHSVKCEEFTVKDTSPEVSGCLWFCCDFLVFWSSVCISSCLTPAKKMNAVWIQNWCPAWRWGQSTDKQRAKFKAITSATHETCFEYKRNLNLFSSTVSICSCYLMFKLLQGVRGEFQAIFRGAVGHPLQHHLIRLYPVADTLLHHWGTEDRYEERRRAG